MQRTVSTIIILAALATTLLWSRSARAQYPGTESGVVSGNGMITITRQPETMRVQVAIQGKGATLKDALAAVKTRTEAAKKQVATLGANKDSIKVESPKITAQQADQQQAQMLRMQRQMMQQMNKAKKSSKKDKEAAKPAEPVLVSALFTAEWKLDAKTPEDLLIAVHGLQEKIKGADLAGMKEAEKLSPEQEEMLEEMEANQMMNNYGNEGPKPGEPIFVFVSRIPEAERDKAIADAFLKAKTQASKLAKAAGTELGALKSLSSSSTSGNANNNYQYNSRAWRAMQMAGLGQSDDEEANDNSAEAIGAEPGPVKVHVSVMAAFDLGPGK